MISGYICKDCQREFKGKPQATLHVRRVHGRDPVYGSKYFLMDVRWQVTTPDAHDPTQAGEQSS